MLPSAPLARVIVPVVSLPVFIIISVSPTDWTRPELTDVKTPVEGVLAPMIVPSIAPPSTSTSSLAWVAIVPKPKFVRAPGASVAPVPPRVNGTLPAVISWPVIVK